MLLQIRSIMTPRHASVPLCSAAARRQVTVQVAHLDNGSRNVRSMRPKSRAREAAYNGCLRCCCVESKLGVARGLQSSLKAHFIPLQLDLVASRFESRLQGASRQVKSRLDGAEAQQDALASRLDILESQWHNSLAISFMALFLATAAVTVVGSFLPGALLSPFMVWAAVSRRVTAGDLTRACTYAKWDLETAQAEGLADLEACQSQAMDDLAKSQLHDSRLDSVAGSSSVQARRDSTAKQQIKTEVKAVQKRMAQRLKMLQARLKQLRARRDRLFDAWGLVSVLTLVGTATVTWGATLITTLDTAIQVWTPFLSLLLAMACSGSPVRVDE